MVHVYRVENRMTVYTFPQTKRHAIREIPVHGKPYKEALSRMEMANFFRRLRKWAKIKKQ